MSTVKLLTQLENLEASLEFSENLTTFTSLRSLLLVEMQHRSGPETLDLPETWTNLKALDFIRCPPPKNLRKFTNLENFRFSNMWHIPQLPPQILTDVPLLTKLQQLSLWSNSDQAVHLQPDIDLSTLTRLTSLEWDLHLYPKSLDTLAQLPHLTSLDWNGFLTKSSIDGLAELPHITKFKFHSHRQSTGEEELQSEDYMAFVRI